MGGHEINIPVSRQLYGQGAVWPGLDYPAPQSQTQNTVTTPGVAVSGYRESSPSQPSPKSKGSLDCFKAKPNLNFIEQLAGFELTTKETVILGGLVVLASPVLAVGMLAGCGNGEPVEGREEDGGPSANQPPVLVPIGDKEVNENELLEFAISASDPDGDALTYSAANLPSGASFDPATQSFSWQPSFEQAGVYPGVRFEATDGRLTKREEITITVNNVNNVNRAPILDPIGNKTVSENELLEFTISASDPDRDDLTYGASNLPEGASFDPVFRLFSWRPTYDQAGVYEDVRFRVTDGEEITAESIIMTVIDVNRAPVMDPIPLQTADENQLLTVVPNASDPDGNFLAFSGDNLPAGAMVDPTAGTLTWTPTFEQAGIYRNVGITATDGDLSVTQRFDITVVHVNRAPLMDAITNQRVNEDRLLAVNVNASDPDGDALTFRSVNLPMGATVDPGTGTLTWTPTFDQAGVYPDVGITATDGDLSATRRFSITVNNINRAPTLDPIPDQTVNENQLLTVSVNASDPDGDSLTLSGENLPTGASVDSTTGTLSWTPSFAQAGTYSNAGITATDGDMSVTRRFDISVNENRAPILDPIGHQVVEAGSLLSFALSGSDLDGHALTYSAVGLPAGATLDANTGQFNWTPTNSQAGNHVVTFEVSDGDLTASETINIEVRGVSEVLESRITNDAADSWHPSLVWTGTAYGVSWWDDRDGNKEIYFARIDASGNKIGGDARITTNDTARSLSYSLVWTGTEYGVSWYDERDGNWEIYFARIDASGNKIGGDARITDDAAGSERPSLVWTGMEYGVSWMDERDGNYEIYFARIDASGNKLGDDVRITNAADHSTQSSLVWTGTEYGVSWTDGRDGNYEIYFARIDAEGNKIGSDVRITNDAASSGSLSLVWTGTEYGVSWMDERDGNWEIYFARIDAEGNKIGNDVRITNEAAYSGVLSLVWTRTEYGVSWMDERDDNYEIYFTRIDASGNKLGQDVRITNDATYSAYPSLVWTGTEYGVSWTDRRDGNYEIYFARIIGNFTPTP